MADQKQIPKTGKPQSEPARILVIDDDAFSRTLLRKFLKGYEVIEEKDGLTGLRRAQKDRPDLIVSDYMMPKVNGLKLCKLVRMDARTREIPVILLTAVADAEYAEKAKAVGARELVRKSAIKDDLRPAIERILAAAQSGD